MLMGKAFCHTSCGNAGSTSARKARHVVSTRALTTAPCTSRGDTGRPLQRLLLHSSSSVMVQKASRLAALLPVGAAPLRLDKLQSNQNQYRLAVAVFAQRTFRSISAKYTLTSVLPPLNVQLAHSLHKGKKTLEPKLKEPAMRSCMTSKG